MGGFSEDGPAYASVLIYDVPSDSWSTGTSLPCGMFCDGPRYATTLDGELFLTGCSMKETDGEDSEDSEDGGEEEVSCCFAYRNAAWVEVASPGTESTPAVTLAPVRESLLLG